MKLEGLMNIELERYEPKFSRLKLILLKFGENIQNFNIHGYKLSSSMLVELLKLMSNVIKLKIYIKILDGDDAATVNLNHLDHLDIKGELSGKLMKLIKVSPGKLTKFSCIGKNTEFLIGVKEFLKHQQNLKSLSVITADGTYQMPENFIDCSLEELCWDVHKVGNNEKVINFVKSHKNMRKLNISLKAISDDDFKEILNEMIELRALRIFNLKMLTHRGLKNILKLPKLNELSLNFTNLSDREVKEILDPLLANVTSTVERLYLEFESESDLCTPRIMQVIID